MKGLMSIPTKFMRNDCNQLNNSLQRFMVVVALFNSICCLSQTAPQKNQYKKFTPTYHYYPSGDPTGLFYLGGKYYNNWGSAYSKDLVFWKYSPYGRDALRFLIADSTLAKRQETH